LRIGQGKIDTKLMDLDCKPCISLIVIRVLMLIQLLHTSVGADSSLVFV